MHVRCASNDRCVEYGWNRANIRVSRRARMSSSKTTTALIVIALGIAVSLTCATPAFAFDETKPWDGTFGACINCHSDGGTASYTFGVHGNFTNTTKFCGACHTVHVANVSGRDLLPGATITASCHTCHDGTGGEGVYGAIKARLGVEPASAHRTETATIVPGGNASTGGTSTMTLSGLGSALTCTDCHSPHGNDLVVAFRGDRRREGLFGVTPKISSKLLKRRPGGSAVSIAEYGSDWCGACHKGRMSGGAVHNHPAETSATASPQQPHVYARTPILASSLATSSTVLGAMGATNLGYLMPYPRTTGANGQAGRFPICQQCHEDARNPGVLNADGTALVAPYQTSQPIWNQPDGANAADNPRFQTFPHESTTRRMLVQLDDDLCLNCHTPSYLP